MDYLARAVPIAPDRGDIRLNYAKGLVQAGQKDAARQELEALQKAPDGFPGKAEAAALLNAI